MEEFRAPNRGETQGWHTVIQLALAGDQDAWYALHKEHWSWVMRQLVTFRNLAESEREEVAQEVFVRLYRWDLKRLRNTTRQGLLGLLRTTAKNEAIDYLKQHRRPVESSFLVSLDEGKDLNEETYDVPDSAPGPEAAAQWWSCFRHLPPDLRLVFRMVEINQHRPGEIAQELKIMVNTVESRLSKAKTWMTQCMAEVSH